MLPPAAAVYRGASVTLQICHRILHLRRLVQALAHPPISIGLAEDH